MLGFDRAIDRTEASFRFFQNQRGNSTATTAGTAGGRRASRTRRATGRRAYIASGIVDFKLGNLRRTGGGVDHQVDLVHVHITEIDLQRAADAVTRGEFGSGVVIHQTPVLCRVANLANDHGIEITAEVFRRDALTARRRGLPVAAEVAVHGVAVTGTAAFTRAVGIAGQRQVRTQIGRHSAAGAAGTTGGTGTAGGRAATGRGTASGGRTGGRT